MSRINPPPTKNRKLVRDGKSQRLNDRYFTLNIFFINQQAAYLLHVSRYYIKVLKAEYNYTEKKKYTFSPYEKKVVKKRGEKKRISCEDRS